MPNAATVQELLKCDNATANAISDVMYQYISPSWSNDTAASLRMDLKIVAQLANIKIVPLPKKAAAEVADKVKTRKLISTMFADPNIIALRNATNAARERTGKFIATSVTSGPLFRVEQHISRGDRKIPEIIPMNAPCDIKSAIAFIEAL